MVDEKKDQDGPESPQDLREFEYQEMLRAAAAINPRVPDSLSIMTATSTSENILVGSSPPPGSVFHPNLPLACVAGVSLAEVNRVRQESNAGDENRRLVWLRVGDNQLQVYIKYYDLTEEDLRDSEPRRTFEIEKVTDIKGVDESGATDAEKEEKFASLYKLIDQRISRVRGEERQRLGLREKGKGWVDYIKKNGGSMLIASVRKEWVIDGRPVSNADPYWDFGGPIDTRFLFQHNIGYVGFLNSRVSGQQRPQFADRDNTGFVLAGPVVARDGREMKAGEVLINTDKPGETICSVNLEFYGPSIEKTPRGPNLLIAKVLLPESKAREFVDAIRSAPELFIIFLNLMYPGIENPGIKYQTKQVHVTSKWEGQ